MAELCEVKFQDYHVLQEESDGRVVVLHVSPIATDHERGTDISRLWPAIGPRWMGDMGTAERSEATSEIHGCTMP